MRRDRRGLIPISSSLPRRARPSTRTTSPTTSTGSAPAPASDTGRLTNSGTPPRQSCSLREPRCGWSPRCWARLAGDHQGRLWPPPRRREEGGNRDDHRRPFRCWSRSRKSRAKRLSSHKQTQSLGRFDSVRGGRDARDIDAGDGSTGTGIRSCASEAGWSAGHAGVPQWGAPRT